MRKHLLIIILTISLVISSCPMSAFASNQKLCDVNNDGEFFYFALGDSITTGMDTSGALNEKARNIAINHIDCPKTSYPYLTAQRIFESVDYQTERFSNWGIPGYTTKDYYNMLIAPNSKQASFYWNLYKDQHAIIIDELKKADLITANIGSNDLLQDYIYELVYASFELDPNFIKQGKSWDDVNIDNLPGVISAVRNPLLVQISTKLMDIAIGNEDAKAAFKNTINKATRKAGGTVEISIENIIDLLVLLNSDNMENALNRAADKAIDYYEKAIKRIFKMNSKAKIALINCFAPYGSSFDAAIIKDESNPSEILIQGYTLPEVLTRIFNSLSSYAFGLTESKDSYTSVFGNLGGGFDIKDLLSNIDLKELPSALKKYIENYEPILGKYQLPKWMSSELFGEWFADVVSTLMKNNGTLTDWIVMALYLSNPISWLGIGSNAIIKKDAFKNFFLYDLEKELTYPLRYMLVGQPIDKGINYYNLKVKALTEKYGLTYVDISELPASAESADSTYSSWNPHPADAGHLYISNKIVEAVL